VQTRLSKLAQGVAEATFLAMAGMNRLGYTDVPARPIPTDAMLPAVAQGAIGVERRTEDGRVQEMLALIHDRETGLRLAAERGFLRRLDGSCQTPIAGLAELDGDRLRLRGEILRPDGSRVLADDATGAVADGEEIGRAMAARLLQEAGPGFFD
jgi:hydroxymethylbilane synthase